MASIGVRELRQRASELLRRVEQGEAIEVTDRGRPVAVLAPPPEGRPLDALHLATAQLLGRDLTGLVTYDDRMVAAAKRLGYRVVQPR
jgi:prevent-host-death family protein